MEVKQPPSDRLWYERAMKTTRTLLPVLSSLATSTLLLACSGGGHHHHHHHHQPQSAPAQESSAPAASATSVAPDRELSETVALENFDTAVDLMRDAGALSDMSDADWESLRERYRERASEAVNTGELRAVMSELIDELDRSHFAIIPRDAAEIPDSPESAGGTLGLEARFHENVAVVTRVAPGSSAEEAGVQPGWSISAVDEFDLESFANRFGDIENASMSGYHRNAGLAAMLAAAPGRETVLEFVDLEGGPQTRTLEGRLDDAMSIKFGNLPPMTVSTEATILDQSELRAYGVEVPEDFTVGLLRFSVWMIPIMQPINEAIDRFREAEVDAVVIDLRGNPGGVGGLSMGVGGHFTTEATSLGTMFNEFGEINFNTNPQRLSPAGELVEPLDQPLVILVDSMSASTSEIFAGGLQAAGRAAVVGRRTPGMALPAVAEALPNGDILYHAIAEFELPDGSSVEGIGITPDRAVDLDPAAFTDSRDPDIGTAVEWLARPSVDAGE